MKQFYFGPTFKFYRTAEVGKTFKVNKINKYFLKFCTNS
nr:MAG TPA: hypothetical protein [Caudoviricetes sp.]